MENRNAEDGSLFNLDSLNKSFKEADLTYSAGLFDGEGYITIGEARKARGGGFNLKAGVNLTRDVGALEGLHHLFGGSYKPRENAKYKAWFVCGAKAASFLKSMLPYLKIKKEEAQLALEFYSRYKLLSQGRGNKRLPLCAIDIGKYYKLRLAKYHSHPGGKGRPIRQSKAPLL